ncbi:MAG: thiamine pyrophosphate-dependent dehydrogenase E1 component subunit alpha [Chloroflexota bacterium]|nr:MAG: thiamine pyrophosphate-dependent dehydrogenase E1 component subunit alpha [Chloroflexota bacterium]
MGPDLWLLYRQMLRSRRFEEAVTDLWQKGRISGEMHLGIGEEAIAAGIVAHLQDGDAMALDHRGTPPLVMRGVDLSLILREFLGCADGICCGMGGHMHLFSREHLTASSGIVGSAGPIAAGFALAAQHLRPGNIAVAFFGDGAMNQGMLLESFNLAVAWKLPVLFVCKDNEWAIVTRSQHVTGGNLLERARSFGMPALEIDGADVEAVWNAAKQGVDRARKNNGPTFLLARCIRPEGHFLGYLPLRRSLESMIGMVGPIMHSLPARKGASPGERIASLGSITSLIGRTLTEKYSKRRDPIHHVRQRLRGEKARLNEIEKEVEKEIQQAVERALS